MAFENLRALESTGHGTILNPCLKHQGKAQYTPEPINALDCRL